MKLTRRSVLAGGLALGATAHASGMESPASRVRRHLDAVGPLAGGSFHPGRALTAMQALMELPEADRVPLLRQYAKTRIGVPEGVFAVVRALVEVPSKDQAASPWPGVLQPGHLRPPALGGPSPAQPDDLTMVPRWPVVMLEDVPLVVVSDYVLGGKAEPLAMHLEGLEEATWRTKPLSPGSAGSLRYLLLHWGRWSGNPEVSAMLEGQLKRYEG